MCGAAMQRRASIRVECAVARCRETRPPKTLPEHGCPAPERSAARLCQARVRIARACLPFLETGNHTLDRDPAERLADACVSDEGQDGHRRSTSPTTRAASATSNGPATPNHT